MTDKDQTQLPEIGQDIYLPTVGYISHGADDFEGGLCKVVDIQIGIGGVGKTPFVYVEERPGHGHNWEMLEERQQELKERYGDQRGRPDPDYAPEANGGWL
ncbi:hypothetical protein HOA55_05455 [archaeon]|jgi:hypothetical protein|nr:hypothetical protein [archaeon]MBT3577767.1 hypothetical protein [archaeon]MBT6820774.1 hypothetical protein [archaeon]MBT6956317.1 hypothetical protein [archaeon]MBT7025914.1 hypothetical protein [archaeon]